MNARLRKEFRALLLPRLVGAVAAALITIFTLLNEGFVPGFHSNAWPFLIKCAMFVACASIPLLAAMSFGTEYQHRTLPLLLAQPSERTRQWAEKLFALAVTALIVALICPVTLVTVVLLAFGSIRHLMDAEHLQPALIVVILIVTTLCSTGYWTMVARSIIGGVAFSIYAQFMVGVIVGFGLYRIYGGGPLSDSLITGAVVVTGLIHSAFFLWLGHRKFVRLELADITFGEGISDRPGSLISWWPDALRCRANSPFLNLVRKELRLQKTVFVIAGVLLLCWIITLLLSFIAPIPKSYLEGIFGALVSGYVFLLPVLTGCIPLGEERTLGLAGWHLTLPVSARRQWFVKLAVAVGVAAAFGLLIPYLLVNLTAATGKVDAFKFGENSVRLYAVLAAIGSPFLLSFWATTFLGNPIKAVVAAVIAVGVLGSVCELGTWCAEKVAPLEVFPVSEVVAWLQLPIYHHVKAPADQHARAGVLGILIAVSAAIGIVAILAQSYIQFRRVQSRPRILARNAAILAVLSFLLSFWCVDVMEAFNFVTRVAVVEVSSALGDLP